MSINQFLKELGQGDSVKDYSHASKLFVGDNFRLAPRQGFLYHVFIDLNPAVKRIGQQEQKEVGMLVKSVDLPKFTVDTKTLNSYNKPNIVQTKIKYDSVNITFHDDHADVVRGLWFDYYNYYYRDTDLGYQDASGTPNATYFQNTKYSARTKNDWGYTPRQQAGLDTQYIKAIRLYSLSQKRFAEYTLINPTIIAFRHGQHTAGSSDPMANEMTVSYESVLYAAGWASEMTINGFAEIHYDTQPSPLTPAGGGTNSIMGPGGIMAKADNVINGLGKNNPAAFLSAFRGYNTLKNMDLKAVAKNELKSIGTDILRGNNPLSKMFVPNAGNLANGSPIFQISKKELPSVGTSAPGSATSNGESVNKSSASKTSSGVSLPGIGASVMAGLKAGGLALQGGLVAGAGALNKLIKIDPATGSVDSVGQLPSSTTAEQKLASIPTGDTNGVGLDIEMSSAAAGTPLTPRPTIPDDVLARMFVAPIPGQTNPIPTAEQTLAIIEAEQNTAGTTDITKPTEAAPDSQPLTDAQVSALFAEQGATPPTQTNAEKASGAVTTKSADSLLNDAEMNAANKSSNTPLSDAETQALFAEENPSTKLSDTPAINNPTNQGSTAPVYYTGPDVVYAPDGSSSPVDSLGNVLKPLVNGSYKGSYKA